MKVDLPGSVLFNIPEGFLVPLNQFSGCEKQLWLIESWSICGHPKTFQKVK